MGELVNLRRFRKQAKKKEDAERAAENRVVFGRTKAERAVEKIRNEKLHQFVDEHKIEPGDAG